jgi:alpha-beta hydrolase superfamily lysophospholipase
MKSAHFSFIASDGKAIYVRNWLPSGDPKAIVLVAHGMAEHGARYERFAEALTAKGFVVFAPDHRGHGKTAATEAELGYFGDKDGFARVVEDLHELALEAQKRFSGLSLFLFGHSMGSFLSQGYISLYGDGLSGCILSGTSGPMPGVMSAGGKLIAALGCAFKGPHAPAPLATKMSFGSYNDAFKPNRTEFDWLSSDNAEVDKYVADPLCGFVCSYEFYRDLLKGLGHFQSKEAMAKIPKKLPIYLVSGALDPVGGATGSVTALAQTYRGLGIADVEDKLYAGDHHEILNETNRDEVTADILAWIDKRQARSTR